MVNAARHRAVPDTSRAERPDNTKRAEQTTSMRRTLRLIRQDVAPEKKLIGAGVGVGALAAQDRSGCVVRIPGRQSR